MGHHRRALSLLDITLWDITAKVVGLPLFRLLGGLRTEAPVIAGAGYYLGTRFIDDIAQLVYEGSTRLEVMLKKDDPDRGSQGLPPS